MSLLLLMEYTRDIAHQCNPPIMQHVLYSMNVTTVFSVHAATTTPTATVGGAVAQWEPYVAGYHDLVDAGFLTHDGLYGPKRVTLPIKMMVLDAFHVS